MKRAMFLGLLGLGWFGGLAADADDPPAKPQLAKQDPIELAVETALELPPGVRL